MLKWGKGKQKESLEKEGRSKNKPIGSYFILLVIFSVFLIIATGLGVSRYVTKNMQSQLATSISGIALSIHNQLQVVVESERSKLAILANSQKLIAGLDRKEVDDIAILEGEVLQQIPTAARIWIVPKREGESPLLDEWSASYAVKELSARTLEKGDVQAAEAVRQDNKTYFILAHPVKVNGDVKGVLVASFPLDLVSSIVNQLPLTHGGVQIEQAMGGQVFVLASSKGLKAGSLQQLQSIPGTLWHLRYGFIQQTTSELVMILGVSALAAVIMSLLGWWQQRKLTEAFKSDFGLAVTLMDTMLKRTGTPTCYPKLTESNAAISLLTKYAQASFAATKAAKSEKNVAGMPQKAAEKGAITAERDVARDSEWNEFNVPASIFGSDGIRGKTDDVLTPQLVQRIGQAIGTLVQRSGDESVFVGRDVRHTSKLLEEALAAGILASGANVIDLGETPAPLVEFATHVWSSSAGVVIGSGHAPLEYNGLSITLGGKSLSESEMDELRKLIMSGDFSSGSGTLTSKNISAEYIRNITADIQIAEPRKVVVDGGNGVAGSVAVRLLSSLGCEVVELFCEPDGNFPHHEPNPAKAENLSSLILEVQAQDADLGIALGGDGTRLALVDAQGRWIPTDLLIMVLAGDILQRHPGADIIYDVSCSGELAAYILSNGGRPIMWKSGHAEMRRKMVETGALFGAEFSGHLYIKDRWYVMDDAIYAAARLVEVFGSSSSTIADQLSEFPRGVSTAELYLDIEEERGPDLIQMMRDKASFPEADVVDIDGLRLEFPFGWGLVRASDVVPGLVFRFEGEDEDSLKRVQEMMGSLALSVLPKASLPF